MDRIYTIRSDVRTSSAASLKQGHITNQAARRPERLDLKERQLLIAVSSHGGEGHELLRKLCLDSD